MNKTKQHEQDGDQIWKCFSRNKMKKRIKNVYVKAHAHDVIDDISS